MSIVPINPNSELAVITFLEAGAAALSEALDRTDISEIANIKAQAATVETATRQLALSKESQDFATELVRRSEWTLGRAVKKGQSEGMIRPHGATLAPGARTGGQAGPASSLPSPKSFYNSQTEYEDVTAMAKANEAEIGEAIREALAEGNATRAGVARKVRQQREEPPVGRSPELREQRADLIADLAAQGYSSRQMPKRVGVTEEVVRRIARDFDIEIPADRVVGRTRRLDHTHMVASTVNDLVLAAEFIEAQIDLSEVDFTEADEWLSSLTNSIRALNRFKQQIKEHSHV